VDPRVVRFLRPAVDAVRRELRKSAEGRPVVRRMMLRAQRELERALDDGMYGGEYFGQGRVPTDRAFLSGYERYDRDSSNANAAAYLVWRALPATTSLDVGCATGFVVEALRELGIDACGVDVSQYAVDHAALGAQGHLQRVDLVQGLPFEDAEFDAVTAFETLEHLPPEAIPGVLAELRRVTRRYLMATIPSFGPNRNGPGGWFQGKVRDDRIEHYESLGPEYGGPIPYEDLYRDARGLPIEGHLTIASFEWWTTRFEEAGFVRCDQVERRLHHDLAKFGLTKYWNLYVMRVPSVDEPGPSVRSDDDVRAWRVRFGLEARVAADDDLAAVAASPAGGAVSAA
jgi:SAM-dependent methyltransferase